MVRGAARRVPRIDRAADLGGGRAAVVRLRTVRPAGAGASPLVRRLFRAAEVALRAPRCVAVDGDGRAARRALAGAARGRGGARVSRPSRRAARPLGGVPGGESCGGEGGRPVGGPAHAATHGSVACCSLAGRTRKQSSGGWGTIAPRSRSTRTCTCSTRNCQWDSTFLGLRRVTRLGSLGRLNR
jgi:hypothetical protein